jgi:tight adherence protein B
MSQALLLLAVFVGMLAVSALALTVILQGTTVRRRLAEVGGTTTAPDPSADAKGRSLLAPLLRDRGLRENLKLELWRAGVTMSPTDFLAALAILALVGGVAGALLSHKPLWALVGALLGVAAPIAALKLKQAQRKARLEAQLPDMLALISSSLRSGYSFAQGLQTVGQEMKEPIALEALRVQEEVAMGVSMEEALKRLVKRVRSYDLDLVVTAISIQYEVGGNLAELLDTIAETIRNRFRVRAEISALTAEGRLSAAVLCALPIGMAAFLLVRSPDYMSVLFDHPIGRLMLGVAVVLQIAGGLVMRRMISIDT